MQTPKLHLVSGKALINAGCKCDTTFLLVLAPPWLLGGHSPLQAARHCGGSSVAPFQVSALQNTVFCFINVAYSSDLQL